MFMHQEVEHADVQIYSQSLVDHYWTGLSAQVS